MSSRDVQSGEEALTVSLRSGQVVRPEVEKQAGGSHPTRPARSSNTRKPPPLRLQTAERREIPVSDSQRIDNSSRPANSDHASIGPADIEEVHRKLNSLELDDNQRVRLMEFIASKQKVCEVRAGDLEKMTEIGTGNCSVVTRVRHFSSGLIMAKKSIYLDIKPEVRNQIMRELQILHDCNSPYIIGFYGAFCEYGTINICMECMDGGSLDMVLGHAGRMPEPIVSRILYPVLKGIAYLRKNLGMIHRDVKPSNVLMRRNGEVKLCDFGASGELINSVAHSFVGTRSYMAPERISGQPYSTSSDIWSLGLSLVELVTGRYPIPAIEREELYFTAFSQNRETNMAEHVSAAKEGRKLPVVRTPDSPQMSIFDLLVYIVGQPLPHLPAACFSPAFIELVARCLSVVPTDRPLLDELLEHPFVQTVAGTCLSGANRRSSIRFAHTDEQTLFVATQGDPDLADIAFYLSGILPPLSDTNI